MEVEMIGENTEEIPNDQNSNGYNQNSGAAAVDESEHSFRGGNFIDTHHYPNAYNDA
jgi:hypothetical protein